MGRRVTLIEPLLIVQRLFASTRSCLKHSTVEPSFTDRKGEFDKAIADFTEAIRLDPRRAEAYWGRAHAYAKKGEFDKAIADFTEAIRLDPRHAEAYCGRAYAYAKKGEFDKAIADYTEAIRLNPKYAEAY